MQLTHSLDLSDYVLLPEQLEKPIISLFLNNFDFPDIFHAWVDTDPKDWVVIEFLAENVFRLWWEILKFKLVHLKLLHILIKHHLGSLACRSVGG